MLSSLYDNLSPVASTIIALSIMLFGGFLMTRITKLLKLPNVTAYMLAGILLGPFCLNAVPSHIIENTGFLPDIALAFVAFSTGEFFKFSVLKKNGAKNAIITICESLCASLLIFILTFFVLHLNLAFSLVVSALAAATAPTSTLMTIRQTGAKGHYVDTLLQVMAIDNIIGLLAYSIAISIASTLLNGSSFDFSNIILPLAENIGIIIVGGLFGWIMKWILAKRNNDNKLIVSISIIFAFCGLCSILNISPLLGCMSMGTVYRNTSDDDKLFKQLNYFTPPILLLFFVRSGMNFDLNALFKGGSFEATPLIIIVITYFLIRIIGKYSGAFIGGIVTKENKDVKKYLGLALIPQAGVAIGLAAMGARILGGEIGNALQTIILASSVLYELVGPACAKLSLHLSKSYSNAIEDVAPVEQIGKNEVEILIERINKIRSELPKEDIEEKEFTEAAEEYALMQQPAQRRKRGRR